MALNCYGWANHTALLTNKYSLSSKPSAELWSTIRTDAMSTKESWIEYPVSCPSVPIQAKEAPSGDQINRGKNKSWG